MGAKKRKRQEVAFRYWRTSLTLGVVVLGAVVALLEILTRTAKSIEGGTASIWQTGKMIANNTVHIPLLVRTNQILGEISSSADGIAAATERIQSAVAGE